jgi:hypothetical protein
MRPLSHAIIALGFAPVNGAPYEGLVFAISGIRNQASGVGKEGARPDAGCLIPDT